MGAGIGIIALGIIGLIAVVALGLVLWGIGVYNSLTRSRIAAQGSFSGIDVELKRRHDLVPNLVNTVKGYAAHEKQTFESVISARAAAVRPGMNMDERLKAEQGLGGALGRLMAVAEAYPDLKANQNFLQLQGELTATEDRLSAARRFYNTTVKALNTKCQTIPSKWVAPIAKVTEREFFDLVDPAEAAVPSVSFS
jgi:LemA protein